MALELDQKSLEQAFQGRPDIQNAIRTAAVAPAYIELFNQISLHVCSLTGSSAASPEPATKKRRLDEGEIPSRPAPKGQTASNGTASGDEPVLLEINDISVVVPQRKKYTLCFTDTYLYARLPGSKEPVAGMSYAWKDIDQAFCLPVPEKSQKQHNYILSLPSSLLPPSKPSPGTPPPPEPLVFTIPSTAPKPGSISGPLAASASAVSDDYKTLLDWALSTRLKAASNPLKITYADEKLFHSTQRQAHRPDEKAVHVTAFRGSKDGYLFFLPRGILWGFKKPLLFIPHERIVAVSYTSVLQRTFNLSVEVDISTSSSGPKNEAGEEGEGEEETQEFEFSMLDQEDFANIDAFVKRHGLQDRSMAEQRRAKRLNVNVVRDEQGNVVGSVEAGELERAGVEAGEEGPGEVEGGELDDEDDEEEEDYDPGSEGESEGEGTSSSEEEEEGEGAAGGEEGEEDDDEDEL